MDSAKTPSALSCLHQCCYNNMKGPHKGRWPLGGPHYCKGTDDDDDIQQLADARLTPKALNGEWVGWSTLTLDEPAEIWESHGPKFYPLSGTAVNCENGVQYSNVFMNERSGTHSSDCCFHDLQSGRGNTRSRLIHNTILGVDCSTREAIDL